MADAATATATATATDPLSNLMDTSAAPALDSLPKADRAPDAQSSASSSAPAPAASTSTSTAQELRSNAPDLIKLGDQVIIYSSRNAIDSIVLTAGKDLQSRYGHYRHDSMVGVAWGSKIASSNGKGYVYLLKPTPELWTLALPHRTQILYLPDIAFISSYLDVKPGSKIIEAGTGSGSFSHSVARAVGTHGKVHSFEYHEERYSKAKAEFEEHNLQDIITLSHRNVCQDGFDLTDEVDSVFLDVPAPWEAVPHAKVALRKDRQSRICCYSPCIEQVLRTVSALSTAGFSDITMYETLLKTHEPAISFQPSIDEAIARIEAVEQKKSVRREGQIAEAKRRKESEALKRKRDLGDEGEGAEKALKVELKEDVREAMREAASLGATSEEGTPAPNGAAPTSNVANKVISFKQGPLSRGHTSFLTFATLLPMEKSAEKKVQEPAEIEEVEVVKAIVEEAKAEPSAENSAEVEAPMEL